MFAASDTDFIIGCHTRPVSQNNIGRGINREINYLVCYLQLYKQLIYFLWFPFTKRPFNTGRDLVKGDRDRRLIEVKIAVAKGSNFQDFDTR